MGFREEGTASDSVTGSTKRREQMVGIGGGVGGRVAVNTRGLIKVASGA